MSYQVFCFLLCVFYDIRVLSAHIASPSPRSISLSVGQNGVHVSAGGVQQSVETVRVGGDTRSRVQVSVPGVYQNINFGQGSTHVQQDVGSNPQQENVRNIWPNSAFTQPSSVYQPSGYNEQSAGFAPSPYSFDPQRTTYVPPSAVYILQKNLPNLFYGPQRQNDNSEVDHVRVVRLPQWEHNRHGNRMQQPPEQSAQLQNDAVPLPLHLSSNLKPLTLDFVYPTDCQCVPEMFCNEHDIDKSGSVHCEHERVCCHGRLGGADWPINNNITDDVGEQGTGEDEDPKETWADPWVETTTETSEQQDDTASQVKPVELSQPGCVTMEPPKCNCQRRDADPSKLNFRDRDEETPVIIEEGTEGPSKVDFPACGVDRRHLLLEPKIGFGKKIPHHAEFGEFPWTLLLMLAPNGILCSATLVSFEWALTAAHCVAGRSPDSLVVRAGELNTNITDESDYEYEERRVKEIIVHENYTKEGLHNDIALLKFDSPINSALPHINRICISEEPPAYPCFVTGWGAERQNEQLVTNGGIMKKIEVRTVKRAYCEEKLRQTDLGPYFNLSKSTLCAEAIDPLVDSQYNDGGGPLFCQTKTLNRQATLVGIVSWGKKRSTGAPGVYTSIRAFKDWIKGHLYF